MPGIAFDRFYKYDDLTEILNACASEYPNLFTVESIGKSFEGREIWLATLTNFDTGKPLDKPGFWIEANIHASEVTGATAALHLINKLLTEYGSDEKVTRVMDTRVFYVVPRLNPDGAELALAEHPKIVRSSVRPYPRTDEQDGLFREDVDKDGRLLAMRIPDPNGSWKKHAEEPRLMIPREPDEEGGDYFRVLPEGSIRNYDGVLIKQAPPLEGLDINRNWPAEWEPEGTQPGSGPYPASEPEIRAAVQAIVDRPNVTGYITYHTFSAVHLRPYSGHDDEHFPTNDLRTYKKIGEKATEITGYPAISVFHDFKYDPKTYIHGTSDDWMYDHLGVYAWCTEFWSPMRQAGISDYKYIDWFRDHPVEDDLKMIAWSDEKLDGSGFVDWYEFDHPQLGRVELGGWNFLYCWTNPPPQLLEKEIERHADFAIFHLLISPRLEIQTLEVISRSEQIHAVRLVITNSGWLPTNVSEKAVERKAVRPVEVELSLPEGAELITGESKAELGQLTGRDRKLTLIGAPADYTTDRAKYEWVIRAKTPATIGVEVRHDRAGTIRRELQL